MSIKSKKELAAALIEARERIGLNKDELAIRADLKPGTYRTWELGLYDPAVLDLAKVARALNCSLDSLVFGSALPALKSASKDTEIPEECANEVAGCVKALVKIYSIGQAYGTGKTLIETWEQTLKQTAKVLESTLKSEPPSSSPVQPQSKSTSTTVRALAVEELSRDGSSGDKPLSRTVGGEGKGGSRSTAPARSDSAHKKTKPK